MKYIQKKRCPRQCSEYRCWVIMTRGRLRDLSPVWSTSDINSLRPVTPFSHNHPFLRKTCYDIDWCSFRYHDAELSICLSATVSYSIVTHDLHCMTLSLNTVAELLMVDGTWHRFEILRLGGACESFFVSRERYTPWILTHQEWCEIG